MLKVFRDDGSDPELMRKVFRYRHDVFVERLGWKELRRPDGLEVDQFDSPEAIHLVATRDDAIAGYTRLLPSTRPHLLTHAYPEILRGRDAPIGEDIYEWTRASGLPNTNDGQFIYGETTKRLYLGVIECCRQVGIRSLTAEAPTWTLNMLMEMGFDVSPIAAPSTINGFRLLPILAHLKDDTLEVCRALFGIDEPVLVRGAIAPSIPVLPDTVAKLQR